MNETSHSAKRSLRPGSLFVVAGIMFCTMGSMKLLRGLARCCAVEEGMRRPGDLIIGGIFLAAGLINLAVGLARKKATAEGGARVGTGHTVSSGPVLHRALGQGLTMGGGAILGISVIRQMLAEQGQTFYGLMIVGAVAIALGVVLIRAQRPPRG